ncbi:MAG: HIT family protein [Deltaproteobacteria bacterium]|uniref:HIT family protein n=1 Tax=Candidatus Zymogenus saltonus TaxID=2844893 RepID=A0A9D8KA41_9DELT|nr:HIT family protein [Candidatus Zymogenus saltonus]
MTSVKGCVFCEMPEDKKILREELIFACLDKYPVAPGHTLIVTKRHVANWFEASKEERRAIDNAILALKEMLDREHRPDGYNIGVNIGRASGQTIDHLHVHLIPRYKGDVYDPWGGVRGVIPEKRLYPKG